MLELKLAESNALTGALKFEVPGSEGQSVEPRGKRPPPKKKGSAKHPQKHQQGKRGRPGNIRHQGKGKKKR